MHEVVNISDRWHHCSSASQLSQSVMCSQCDVTKFLAGEKESVRNSHTHLCNVYESVTINRSTVGPWAKILAASKTGKSEFHDLPQSDHLSCHSCYVLKCCSVLMTLIARINALQPNNRHSVFQSSKQVLDTSWDLRYSKMWVRWVTWNLTVEQKLNGMFWSWHTLSHTVTADKT